jgi:hypothetical protein
MGLVVEYASASPNPLLIEVDSQGGCSVSNGHNYPWTSNPNAYNSLHTLGLLFLGLNPLALTSGFFCFYIKQKFPAGEGPNTHKISKAKSTTQIHGSVSVSLQPSQILNLL